MMKKLLMFILVSSISPVLGARDFETVARRNFWNDGWNAAGLRQDTVSASNAELGADYRAGEFRNVSDPEREFRAGALARSIRHLKKVTLAGHFSFDHNEQYGACGSMLMDAEAYPFDSYEFNPGRKTFQLYGLSGMISADIAPGWRLGGRADLDCRNASKQKDLRYTGYLMKLDLAPSFVYSAGEFSVGATIHYRRSAQTVNAEQIGSSKELPRTFFDEGAMVGSWQEWTGTLSHLSVSGVSGFPVTSDGLGAGVQFRFGGLYLDAEYSTLGAYAGEKQTIWYRYKGSDLAFKAAYRTGKHALRLNFDWQTLGCSRTVSDKVTTGGVTINVEYGMNGIQDRDRTDLNLEYEYLSDSFEIRARAFRNGVRTLAYPMAPYFCDRRAVSYGLSADAAYHFRLWDFKASALLRPSLLEDLTGSFASALTTLSSLTLLKDAVPDFYSRFLDYSNRMAFGGGLAVRRNFRNGMYGELHGNAVLSRWSAGFKFGYNF